MIFRLARSMFYALILVSVFCNVLMAQNLSQDKNQSKMEKFSAQDGVLLKKEFIDIGEFKKCEIQIVIRTDVLSGKSEKGLKISHKVKSSYSSETKSAFLDVDELNALIASINTLISDVFQQSKENYTEYIYTSRGGFQAGCFWANGSWSAFLKLEKYDGDSYVWFDSNDYQKLLALLLEAQSKLS